MWTKILPRVLIVFGLVASSAEVWAVDYYLTWLAPQVTLDVFGPGYSSSYFEDEKPYEDASVDATVWVTCDLRNWLWQAFMVDDYGFIVQVDGGGTVDVQAAYTCYGLAMGLGPGDWVTDCLVWSGPAWLHLVARDEGPIWSVDFGAELETVTLADGDTYLCSMGSVLQAAVWSGPSTQALADANSEVHMLIESSP